MREWAKFDWENRSCKHASICLGFSSPRKKGELRRRRIGQEIERSNLFSSLFAFSTRYRDRAKMQMSKVSTRSKERKMGDIECDGTLRYNALIALCNVLIRFGNIRICIKLASKIHVSFIISLPFPFTVFVYNISMLNDTSMITQKKKIESILKFILRA